MAIVAVLLHSLVCLIVVLLSIHCLVAILEHSITRLVPVHIVVLLQRILRSKSSKMLLLISHLDLRVTTHFLVVLRARKLTHLQRLALKLLAGVAQ